MIRAKFVNARPMSGVVRITVDVPLAQFAAFNALVSDDMHVGLGDAPSAPKVEKPPAKRALKNEQSSPPAPTPLEMAIAERAAHDADHGGTPHDDNAADVSDYEQRSNPEDRPAPHPLDIPGFLKRDHPQEPVEEESGSPFGSD